MPEKNLHLFDTFEGFTDRNVVKEKQHTGVPILGTQFSDTSLDEVRYYISPKNNNVMFYKGYFPETIPQTLYKITFAFVHLDADLYESTLTALHFFYPRMSVGGMIVIHDYNAWLGARKASDNFFIGKPEVLIPLPDKSGSALVIKQG